MGGSERVAERADGCLVSALLVVMVSLGEAFLAIRAGNDCDVGINASANALSIVWLGIPVLLAVNALVVLIADWATRWATQAASQRRAWMWTTTLLVLVLLAYAWWIVVATPASYPDPLCPGNVPPWAPSWLPS